MEHLIRLRLRRTVRLLPLYCSFFNPSSCYRYRPRAKEGGKGWARSVRLRRYLKNLTLILTPVSHGNLRAKAPRNETKAQKKHQEAEAEAELASCFEAEVFPVSRLCRSALAQVKETGTNRSLAKSMFVEVPFRRFEW